MKIKQNGFALIESLLIILILAVVGFGGYYVWHTQHDKSNNSKQSAATSNSSSSPNIYTDSQLGFTLTLPQGWSYIKEQPQLLDNGQPDLDSNGNPIMMPAKLMPNGSSSQSTDGIVEFAGDTSTLSPKDYFKANGYARAVDIGNDQSATINGYDAYIVNFNEQGQGGHSKTVVVAHGGKVVQFFYYTDVSMNKNADKCDQIINSIKF